jgi:hypothetical protein
LRIPTIYPDRYFVEEGGLISYGVDTINLFQRAPEYVSRILRGTVSSGPVVFVDFSGSDELCVPIFDFVFCVLLFGSLDIENPSIGLIRGGLTVRATWFVAEVAASPLREPPCPGLAGWRRASALLLMQFAI